MEPAKIDWKRVESVFVVDEMYEGIKAPKWVDFNANFDNNNYLLDDEAWFCRPECNHPKTVEDLIKLKASPKVQRSASVSEILPLGERNRRDATLKRRPGIARPLLSSKQVTKSDKFYDEDGENLNPNYFPTPSKQYNSMKLVIESSTEESKKKDKGSQQKQLKSTLSARNLFGGRDIVNQISEFCSELKKLAIRPKEREPLLAKEGDNCGEAFLDKGNGMEEVKAKSKKKVEVTENTPPIPSPLDLNKKQDKDAAAAQIQTCPPSPQCFSAGRSPKTIRTPPLKPASRSRLQVRGILQEVDQKNKELIKAEPVDHNNTAKYEQGKTASPVVLEREAPLTLDVFWFLKPCTRLSS